MTLSTPMKTIGLACLALVLGAAGVLMLATRHSKPSASAATAPVVQVVQVSAKTTHPAKPVKPAKPKLLLNPTLPAAVRAKLLHSRTVVAYVYTGLAASDRAELADVRSGAHDAHVPFVALDVTREQTADQVYGWVTSAADPNVVIVKQPGKIVFQVSGLADRQTVAQAASSAR